MRTRAATEGRPYKGSDVGAGLRARPISPNNRLCRQPPEGRPGSQTLRFLVCAHKALPAVALDHMVREVFEIVWPRIER